MTASKDTSKNKSLVDKLFDGLSYLFDNHYVLIQRISNVMWGMIILFAAKPWATHIEIFVRGGRVTMPIRWLLGGLGLFFIFFGLLYRFSEKFHEAGTICPKCRTPFGEGLGRAPKSGKCPQCNIPLEPIDGFYERHPELKDEVDELPEDLMDDLK